MRRRAVLLGVLLCASTVRAAEVSFTLTVDYEILGRALRDALEADRGGEAVLWGTRTGSALCGRFRRGSWRHSSGSHAGGGPASGGSRRAPPRGRAPGDAGGGVTWCAPRRATEPQPFRGGGAAASAARLRRGAGLRGGGVGLMAMSVARAGRDEAPTAGGIVDWRNPAATYSPRGPPPKYHRRWRA